MLCAGVTVYKGLKVTDTQPGDWVVISGIGGLGHMAVQYAKAMDLNVAAVDVDDAKLALARRLGATVTVNARTTDPVAYLKKEIGGAHGALVTAVSPKAFEQAIGMVRRGGTVSLIGRARAGFDVMVHEVDATAAERGRDRLVTSLDRAVTRQRLTDAGRSAGDEDPQIKSPLRCGLFYGQETGWTKNEPKQKGHRDDGGLLASCYKKLVELRGIEPRTSCMPCKRSPS